MEKSTVEIVLTPELLGLSDIEIQEVKLTRDNRVVIRVKSTRDKTECHQCGGPTNLYGYGRMLQLRHLPMLGKPTLIEITPPRGICPKCDKTTTTQTLSWFDRNAHHTKAYEQHILLSLVHSTLADVSIKENISEQSIQLMLDKTISQIIDWKHIKKLGVMGLDEISLKKGYQDFVTLITHRMQGEIRILSVIRGREKASIKAFLSSIPQKKRKTISAVCCDLYDGYMNAAKEVFGDTIPVVADRYHVAKLYRGCLVSLRKKELMRLRQSLPAEEYQSLKIAIAILVKQKDCYSKQEKKTLEKLFRYSPALKAAYRYARQLTAVFNGKHRKVTAKKKINEWVATVKISEVTCFNRFIETLEKRQDEIANYFIHRDTSGFVEGFNNKVKVMKRRCYGIFNVNHFFQRLLLDLSGYRLYFENHGVIATN